MNAQEKLIPLAEVSPGKEVTLVSFHACWGLQARLTAMGLKKGSKVKVLHSIGRGPCVVMAGDTRLCLGRGMALKILVKED